MDAPKVKRWPFEPSTRHAGKKRSDLLPSGGLQTVLQGVESLARVNVNASVERR